MSHMLLTLEQAKREIRLDLGAAEASSSDSDPEAGLFDAEIVEIIEEVSEAIILYLKDAASEFLDSSGNIDQDSDGNPDIPLDVRRAAKLFFRLSFEHTDEANKETYANGRIPDPVVAILGMRRVPTLA